jgi:lipopolysaccharide/colanic/teichoic acid biosynthesis glycosyltransferase
MDELPQLWSILKGDMSFVGPRPYREFFVNRFRAETPKFDLSLLVRPGLTGLAQVHARRDLQGWQKWRFDCLYIQKQSFGLDMRLILLSAWVTLLREWESRRRFPTSQ